MIRGLMATCYVGVTTTKETILQTGVRRQDAEVR